MSVNCSLTGEPIIHGVVDVRRGYVYEKRVIEKHIAETGVCPHTEEQLAVEDLVEIKTSSVAKPRPPTATSIPSMLQLFQNEWDAVMLESFELKKHLEAVRQELAHALYQHDAACRVIARLIKERDEARAALASGDPAAAAAAAAATTTTTSSAGPSEATDMETDGGSSQALPDSVTANMKKTSKQLSKGRKKRAVSKGLTEPSTIASFAAVSSNNLHSTSPAGVLGVDVSNSNPDEIVTAGQDKKAVLFNKSEGVMKANLVGHSKKVTSAKFHPNSPIVVTSSADSTARLYGTSDVAGDVEASSVLSVHSSEVVGTSFHATGDYLATASTDKSWAFWDLETATALTHVYDVDGDSPFSSVAFHPDGLILGTGTQGAEVVVWDVQSRQVATRFSGHDGPIVDLCFSENGYYLATASGDKTVKLWDLRAVRDFRTISLAGNPGAVSFDFSGKYLAVSAGPSVLVYTDFGSSSESEALVVELREHRKDVTGVAWGPEASFLASTSKDRALKIWTADS